MQAQFVEQFSVAESKLDIGCRYRWKWDWLDVKDGRGVSFSQYYQKLKGNGSWWCELCKKSLDYSKSGGKALTIHAGGQRHKLKYSEWKKKKERAEKYQSLFNIKEHKHKFDELDSSNDSEYSDTDSQDQIRDGRRASKKDAIIELKVDVNCKYKWKSNWFNETDDNGVLFSEYYQKIRVDGGWWCDVCKRQLDYSNSGKKALLLHASGKRHKNLYIKWKNKKDGIVDEEEEKQKHTKQTEEVQVNFEEQAENTVDTEVNAVASIISRPNSYGQSNQTMVSQPYNLHTNQPDNVLMQNTVQNVPQMDGNQVRSSFQPEDPNRREYTHTSSVPAHHIMNNAQRPLGPQAASRDMDYNTSVQFISSLAKSLGTLCNGYIGFDSWLKVTGTLYLALDTGKTIQCVIDEKVCRQDEASATLISNSSVAQEASGPLPPGSIIIPSTLPLPTQHSLPTQQQGVPNHQGLTSQHDLSTLPTHQQPMSHPQQQMAMQQQQHMVAQPGQHQSYAGVSGRQDVFEEVWEDNYVHMEPLGNIHDLVEAATLADHLNPDKAAQLHQGPYIHRPEQLDFKQEFKPLFKTPKKLPPRLPRIQPQETSFNCPICGNKFTRNTSLQVHMRRHTGETPFKCSICQKGFIDVGSLKKHSRIHTNEKPFKCDSCDKGFAQSGNLRRHKATHLEKKTPQKNCHFCDVCGNGFTRKDAMKKHKLDMHTLTAGNRCKGCGKCFADKLLLLVHKSKSLQCRQRKNV